MGFNEKWVGWIKLCDTIMQYMMCMNGSYVGPINLSKGLRQGNNLSPYLFLISVEGLSHLLKVAADKSDMHGCCISASAHAVTHLLFVDVSFLSFNVSTEETQTVKNLLNEYEQQSGQAVNFHKSGSFFSFNDMRDKQHEISNIQGVHNELKDSKYMGLRSLIGRSKKKVFSFVKERV